VDEDLDLFPEEPAPRKGRVAWGAVVGAAFGLVLGAVGAAWGFKALLSVALLALIGGFLGRLYLREGG